MPKFAANLTTMFSELPIEDRFLAARSAGFHAVEYLFPYADSAETIRDWLNEAELQLILINTSPGDFKAGERGIAGLPDREDDFAADFEQSIKYARVLSASMIHVMAGVVPTGVSIEDCETTFVDNVRAAATKAADQGMRILLEPLNTQDVPGYLHTTTSHTCELIERIERENVKLQYDLYHRQIMEGNLARGIRDNFEVLGHVQFSSVPGRHEPQYGEVNVSLIFQLLDDLGYAGWVGCEYRPKTTTAEGLGWGKPFGLGVG